MGNGEVNSYSFQHFKTKVQFISAEIFSGFSK